MIKQVALTGVLLVLIVLVLAACASPTNDTLNAPSASQSSGAVPGEKVSDERYGPGPMGSGNVRW